MRQRCQEGLPPLRTLDPTFPEPLETLVMRCLEIDRAARFQTTTDLCAALAAIDDAGELIPPPRYLTRRMVATATLLVTALVAVTYYLAYVPPVVQHDPVSVVIADFDNRTSDPAFDRTLEPMLKLALEGAGFISAYDRSIIGRTLGVRPPETLDERAALEIAVKQGLGVVISGAVERQGDGGHAGRDRQCDCQRQRYRLRQEPGAGRRSSPGR
jgi:hypothetical protein